MGGVGTDPWQQVPIWVSERLAAARVAYLATADQQARPHAVPVVFAVDGASLISPIDAKRKSGAPLRRLANLRANPVAALLFDGYGEDWRELWWVRLDVAAEIIGPDHSGFAPGVESLCRKYPQYRDLGWREGFTGLVVLSPRRGVAWHASGKSWSADLACAAGGSLWGEERIG